MVAAARLRRLADQTRQRHGGAPTWFRERRIVWGSRLESTKPREITSPPGAISQHVSNWVSISIR
jgi:hypothetical protein